MDLYKPGVIILHMEQQIKFVTFIDHIGRTIYGELNAETDDTITVRNPAIMHTQPTPEGKLNVQTIPLYFREFISEKNRQEGTLWLFRKSNIVLGVNVENDPRLLAQYTALFAAVSTPTPAAAPAAEPKVVKLFDA